MRAVNRSPHWQGEGKIHTNHTQIFALRSTLKSIEKASTEELREKGDQQKYDGLESLRQLFFCYVKHFFTLTMNLHYSSTTTTSTHLSQSMQLQSKGRNDETSTTLMLSWIAEKTNYAARQQTDTTREKKTVDSWLICKMHCTILTFCRRRSGVLIDVKLEHVQILRYC